MSGHATINRLYRLVWSETLGAWVAVAENTRGRGKRSGRGKLLAALFAGVAASMAQAAAPPAPAPVATQLPTGGQVVGGAVAIGQQGATMTVTQATQRGAIDWQTFNVGSQAQVNFVQPSTTAVTLNRVLDTQASQIHGRISANGQVFLSNPNGVYFSPTASADVGALVATTHGIDSADFMAGGATFTRNGATGSVVNDGNLNAGIGGYIALLAPAVRNNGVVIAQAGTVALASGEAISLQFDARQSLVGVLVTPSQIDALVENGNAVKAPGGMIVMSAQAAKQLQDGVVRNTGTIEASGLTTRGGKVVLESSGLVDNSGVIDASGSAGNGGGRIAIDGQRMLSAGTIRADGGTGSIATSMVNGIVETTSAMISATGGGGDIGVTAGTGSLYSSGTYTVDGLGAGQTGGKVVLGGDTISLMGAKVSASGSAGGGTILVGGDYQGAPSKVGGAAIANARETRVGQGVSLAADAIDAGNGGKVVVWSDQNTVFAGAVSATGGAAAGNGGVMEVSGKQTLHFAGKGDAHAAKGTAGSLLLDPKDIYIDADLSGQLELRDPHPSAAGGFGTGMTALTTTSGSVASLTGYVTVTSPYDDLGASNAGAVYLFRQSDQALISTLYGTHVDDQVGSNGVTSLTNGNFVVSSNYWNAGRGAVTFGNGITGWGGTPTAVSSANSLVGSTANHTSTQGYATSDGVGGSYAITALSNGNYLVGSPNWSDRRGALTFGDGSSGVAGVVSSTNSLVGSTALTNGVNQYTTYLNGDQVGSSVTVLPNGNFVLANSAWSKGVGAVTFGTSSAAVTGVLGAGNSLVGTTSRSDSSGNGSGTDKVGTYLTQLNGSSFLVYGSSWNNGAGSVTYFDGVNPIVGVVAASNSLVGAAGDGLSSAGINLLGSNNAFIIRSPGWNGSKGAVTWVPYGTDVKTVNVGTAGVVGAASGDSIGSAGVTVLSNNDYVISSPSFNGTRGASTLVDGSTGSTKVNQANIVAATNSLVGSQAGDMVGSGGIVALRGNGNYVTLSPYWANGGAAKAGAVTWNSGASPTLGAVGTGNSLVGSNANDRIGSWQYNYNQYNSTTISLAEGLSVTALANGNYVVASPMFNGSRGAATWVSGATGATVDGGSTIVAANSLMGSNTGDFVGGFVTPVDYPNGLGGTIHSDYVGNGVTALSNGNFVVSSSYWRNGAALRAGAVSWSSGSGTPTVGAVSSANSLVGTVTDDRVGVGLYNGNGLQQLLAGYDSLGNQLYSGNYVVSSTWWNGAYTDGGAVTWGSGTAPLTGTISRANSVLGNGNGDAANWVVTPLAVSGNYLIQNKNWNNGAVAQAGAVSFVNGATGRLSDYAAQGNQNIVSSANSLVGSHANDHVGESVDYLYAYDPLSQTATYTGNYLVLSKTWDNGSLADAGAVTWGGASTGVSGIISSANSIVGAKANAKVGTTYLPLYNGNYVVSDASLDINGVVNAGAAAWVDGTSGRLNDYAARGNRNLLSAANALVGSHTGDKVGNYLGVSAYYALNGYNPADPGYFIISDQWNCTAGALTYIDAAHSTGFIAGVIGASNSAIGTSGGTLYGGLSNYPTLTLVGSDKMLVNFTGGTGLAVFASTVMPGAPAMSIAGATQFGDAEGDSQAMTPDYIAGVLRTGTNLTLQANNDIFVKSGIDASGGSAGGGLSMRAGRSIAILGDIITGNRDLTLVANDSAANGVHDAYRDDGIATISMGGNAVINAGTGAVSIRMDAGAGKTYANAGSIALNSITAGTINVVNQGDGLGTTVPDFSANCCGYALGYRAAGADVVLNTGAVLRASGAGTAVTLAAKGKFKNNSGSGGGTIVTSTPAARWLVYASAPGTSTFGGLDSGNTAVWNTSYSGSPVAQGGNRYVFQYQPTVTVGTQDVSKTYGQDVTSSLTSSVVSLSGAQAAVAGAYLGDTVASAISGTVVATSTGAAATAGASSTPYGITVDLSGVTGNNGYAVTIGSSTPRTLTVNKKAVTVTANDATKTYDGTAFSGGNGVTVAGLANNETASVLGGTLVYGGAAQGAINAGAYALTASGLTSSNYTFSYQAGQLLINARALVAVTANLVGAISKVYDGNLTATLGSGNFSLSGFATGEGATVTRTVGTYDSRNAGARTVTASLSAGDFTANSGTQLSNYILPTTASGSGVITARSITITAPSVSKTYDGTVNYSVTAGNLAAMGASLVGGDVASSAAIAFTDKNAGAGNRAVALSSAVINDGNNGANYAVTLAGNSASTITPRTLNVTATGQNRVYNAGTTASVSLQDDRIAGDTLSLSNTGAQFADKNAGNAKAITVSGIAKTGTDAGNYVLASTSAAASADIARAQLVLSGVTAVNRSYNTGLAVTLAGTPTVTALGGDIVTVGGSGTGSLVNKNAGTGKAVTVGGYTITDTNYTLVQPTGLTVDIAPAVLALGGLSVNGSKTYDGTTSAALTGSAVVSGLNGEVVGVLGTASGQFANANAGSGKAVTVSGLASTDANYTIGQQAGLTGAIAKAPLTVTINGVSKVYDGSATAALGSANFAVTGLVGAETIAVGQTSGAYDSKNAGVRSVSASLSGASYSAGNGALLANYLLPSSASGSGIISPKSVTLAAPSVSKVYDGSTAYSTSAGDLASLGAGLVGGDAVASASLSFNDKNAGSGNRGVAINSAVINDGNNGANYSITYAASTTGTIAPRVLNVSASGSNRVYDGSTGATITLSDDRISGDVIDLSNASASFTDKNAGIGKTVVVAGIGKAGVDAANYVLAATSASTTATIAKATLGVALTGIDKVYDGSSGAQLGAANFAVSGLVAGESIAVGTASAVYDSRNVGSRSVTTALTGASYVAANGASLDNYVLPASVSGTAVITPKSVTLAAPSVSKVYDGTTAYNTSVGDLASLGGSLVGGDAVSSASLSFADKNAGSGNRAVLFNGATINDGNNGANYSVTLAAGSGGTIAPRVLNVSATGANRVYDASTGAAITLSDDRVAGDFIDLSNAGASFTDKNAGSGKTVVVGGIGKAGVDAANYVLANTSVTTTADIARAPLVVTGVSAVGRAYDTALGVALSGTPTVHALGNDVVTVQGSALGTVDSKNAGAAKSVSVAGFTTQDNNYYLVQPQGLTVDITPAVLSVSGLQVAVTKTFDGSRTATLSGSAVVSGMGGEVVSVLGNGSGLFADANAGINKPVTLAGFASSDSNYVIGQQAGLVGTIAKAPLTVTLNGVTKVYDGSTAATLGAANFSVAGLIGADSIGIDQTSATYDSRNAGVRSVSAALSDHYVAANGTLLSNYVLPASSSASAVITPKSVILTAPSISKVYDGSTAYATKAGDLANLGSVLVEGDTVGMAAFTFADKNAGSGNRGVSLNSATVNDGNNGANYSVTLAGNTSGSITPRTLTVAASAANRVYDAGTGAAVTLSDDRVAGDALDLSNSGATFTDKNAGAGKTVVVAGIAKSGADAANYVLASSTVTTKADIARANLVLQGVSAVTRAYDGGATVAVTGAPTVKALGNDVVAVSGSGVGQLADKNAGQGKAVAISGFSIADSNYNLVAPSGVTVNIAPAVLALNGLNVTAAKTYDGTRNVTLTGSATVTGLNGEKVSVLGSGVGQFADKNVGSGKAITVSGLQASDSNYSIGQQAGLTGSIAPASLAVTGVTALDKLFDGSTTATLSGSAKVSAVAGDAVSVTGTPVASFASADAGIAKAVKVSGFMLAGADAGNYSVVQPVGLTATINADASLVPPPVGLPVTVLPAPPLTLQIADTAPVLTAPVSMAATASAGVAVAPSTAATPASTTASGIVVSLVREPARQQSGMVTVMVPKQIAQGAAGFSFPLPAQLVEAAAVNREQVVASTTSGAPLPSWLTYDNASKSFTATAAPAGSLPLQVMLTIGVQQAVIVITEGGQ